MTDLATPATETVAPATPAPRGGSGSAWVKWLARRLGLALLTLWLCSVLVFFATAALGDPVRAILGKDFAASPERAAALMGDHREGEVLATGDRAAPATPCGSGLARGTALTAAGSQDDGEGTGGERRSQFANSRHRAFLPRLNSAFSSSPGG